MNLLALEIFFLVLLGLIALSMAAVAVLVIAGLFKGQK
ncbi:hypothetical protein FHX35_001070 [Auritidibacter ignavus]|nr:hypothetical protein [Auritidibacter ignavus]